MANDTPASAIPILYAPVTFDLTVKTGVPGLAPPCGPSLTNVVWFSYTAGPVPAVIAFNVSTGTRAEIPTAIQLSMWNGALVPNGNVCLPAAGDLWGEAIVPANATAYIQVSCTPGEPGADANLIVSIQIPGNQVAPPGSIFVTNDTGGLPAIVMSTADGAQLQGPATDDTEFGDAVSTGEIALGNSEDENNGINIFDQNLKLIAAIALPSGCQLQGIKSNRTDTFYYNYMDGSGNVHVSTVSKGGVPGGMTWDLPAGFDGLCSGLFAVTRDGSKLYYGAELVADAPIHVFDLANNTPLSDLAAGIPTFGLKGNADGFVGADGSIFAGYFSGSAGKIVRYAAGGTVLQTYNLPTANVSLNHFAIDPSDTSFWVWSFSGALAVFTQYRMSDGAVIRTVSRETADNGSTNPWPVSGSCPLIILTQAMAPQPTSPPAPPPPGPPAPPPNPPYPPYPPVNLRPTQTLVYDLKGKRFFADQYPSPVVNRTWEPGAGVHDQILGHFDGTVDVFGGTTDQGSEIQFFVRPPNVDAGDARRDKLFSDLFVEGNPQGGPGFIVIPSLNDFQTDLSPTGLGSGASGRQPFVVGIAGGLGLLARNLGITLYGSTSKGTKFWLWEPAFVPKVEVTDTRATDYENGGLDGAKFVQGLIIQAQTGGVDKRLLVEYDGGNFSEVFTINDTVESQIPYSFHTPFIAHLVRIVPLDDVPWHYYGAIWKFQPYPELVTTYQTPPTTKDFPGFSQDERALIAHISTVDFDLVVQADDIVATYRIVNSGGIYTKTNVLFSPNKGLWYQYACRTVGGATGLRLFLQDCEIRSRSWGSQAGYQPLRIFGEQSRETSAARI